MADNDSQKYMRGVMGFNGIVDVVPTNTPPQYSSRKTQYMADRTFKFDNARAYLATDYVEAYVQGISGDYFYVWKATHIRLSDVSKNSQATLTGRKSDDRKIVLFPDESIDYVPIGAKIKTMGSTWIVINPENLSSAKTTCMVARCNASFNSYDEYGNVVTEPIVVESYQMDGNDNKSASQMVLMNGYFKVICQLNPNTAKLHENSRIILGTKAYHITGLTDFMQEFSGDRESCHYLTFDVRVEEPTELDDVTKDFVAGGKEYTFGVAIHGNHELAVGNSTQLTAVYTVNGEASSLEQSWVWESSDPSKATVDDNGVVTAIAEGEYLIKATLIENTHLTGIFNLVNTAVETESISFTTIIPLTISQFDMVTLGAAVFLGGKATDKPVQWSFSNADIDSYATEVADDGKSAVVTCLKPSETPLVITISQDGVEPKSVSIELEGY